MSGVTNRALALAFALAGCGHVVPLEPDAYNPGDVADSSRGDAAACDPTHPFDPPVRLAGFDTSLFEFSPRLSPDELTLYVGIASDTYQDLFVASRGSIADPFGSPTRMAVNGTANELTATVSGDGLTLVFESTRDGTPQLYVATRTSPLAEFGAVAKLANVNSGTDVDAQPFLTSNGQALWFTSTRPGGVGSWNIYRATKAGTAFGNPSEVAELDAAGVVNQEPVLSDDELTVYFASTRGGGRGGEDIWMAHRTNTGSPFAPATVVSELNSTTDEFPAWLSPDSCRLYFASGAGGSNFDVFVATRHP